MSATGANPLAYQGVRAPRPPTVIDAQRAPNGTDINYIIGDIWVDRIGGGIYMLGNVLAGVATWVGVGGGASDVNTINSLAPTAGNINIVGTAGQVAVASAGSTVTLSLPAALVITTSVSSPLYTAPAATDMDILAAVGQDIDMTMGDAAGANNISFFSSTPGLVASLNSLGTFTSLGDMITSRSAAGVNVTHQITNSDNTSLTSNAQLEIATGGAASGDSGVVFQVSGVATNWFAGLDNSDSDAFVISASPTAGTSNAMRIDHTSLDVQFGGNVDLVAGNLTASGTLTASLGAITATNGNLVLGTAGNKINIAVGANASAGVSAALAGTPGTIVVATTAVTANSIIMISRNTPGGTLGNLSVPQASIIAGTSFVIDSDANETSTVNWWIIN